MIYDRLLMVYDLTAGTPMAGTLTLRGSHYYAPRTVAHRRFWEAVQANSRVDKAVQIPAGAEVNANQFVLLESAWWRIEEAQHTTDERQLPVTNLALRRWDGDLHVAGAD